MEGASQIKHLKFQLKVRHPTILKDDRAKYKLPHFSPSPLNALENIYM